MVYNANIHIRNIFQTKSHNLFLPVTEINIEIGDQNETFLVIFKCCDLGI